MSEEKKNLYREFGKSPLTDEARARLAFVINRYASNSQLERDIGISNQTVSYAHSSGSKTTIPTIVLMAIEMSDNLGLPWLEGFLNRPKYRVAFIAGALSESAQKEMVKFAEWLYERERSAPETRQLNISEKNNPSAEVAKMESDLQGGKVADEKSLVRKRTQRANAKRR